MRRRLEVRFDKAPYPRSSKLIQGITWEWEIIRTPRQAVICGRRTWGPDDNLYVAWGEERVWWTDKDGRVAMELDGSRRPGGLARFQCEWREESRTSSDISKARQDVGVTFGAGNLYAMVNLQDGPGRM